MNCNNSKCKKEIRNYNICETCRRIYCSNACLTEHKTEEHPQTTKIRNTRNSGMKSMFLKFGSYEKEIKNDPFYDFENFEFVKKSDKKKTIGSGAFGDVYLATNKLDNKFYAIKVMEKSKILENGATLDIIQREISIHRRIIHPNIVRVYSHLETDKFFYLIMEYVNGGSLYYLIKKNKGIDEKKSFDYFIQSCSAVNFLHENNLIHRDLKPENILISDKGEIKLCDFGWCVDITEGSRVTFCGTYEYMSPEIVKEIPYDFEIDVWSLGILLYELTHGYAPFRAEEENSEDYNEIFKQILKYKFKIEKDLSANCIDIISKLLAPSNKQRIKIREVFHHPWTLQLEKEKKEEIRKKSNEEKDKEKLQLNTSKGLENVKILSKQSTQPIISSKIFINSLLEPKINDLNFKNEIKLGVSGMIEQIYKEEKSKIKLKTTKEVSIENDKDKEKDSNKGKKLNKLKSEKVINSKKVKEFALDKENINDKKKNSLVETSQISNNNTNNNIVITEASNYNLLNLDTKNANTSTYLDSNKINSSSGNENSENSIGYKNNKNDLNSNSKEFIELEKSKNYENIQSARNTKKSEILDSTRNTKKSLKNSEQENKRSSMKSLNKNNENDDMSIFSKENSDQIKKEERDFSQNKKNEIFNLDISNVNNTEKNAFNLNLSNTKDFDLSPEQEFPKIKKEKKEKKIDLMNKDNDNDNYFDNVLQNIKQKNRDKNSKKLKNKKIDNLLTSINANLVHSKIYKNNFTNEENKNNEINLNSNRNLLQENNKQINLAENLEYNSNENEIKNLNEEKEDYIVKKSMVSKAKKDLAQIDEVPKKKKLVKKSNAKEFKESKGNLDNEYDIVDLRKNKEKEKYSNSDKSLEEQISSLKQRQTQKKYDGNKNYDYEEDFLYSKDDDNEVKLNFKTKKDIHDEFLESFDKIPKGQKSEKPQNSKRSDLVNKKKDNFLIENKEVKDLDKQLNLDFLPRDLLYNDMNYDDSSKRMLESMEMLERAKIQKLKEKENIDEKEEKEEGFFDKFVDFFNPFKCGAQCSGVNK